jgi:hypothetical protein
MTVIYRPSAARHTSGYLFSLLPVGCMVVVILL